MSNNSKTNDHCCTKLLPRKHGSALPQACNYYAASSTNNNASSPMLPGLDGPPLPTNDSEAELLPRKHGSTLSNNTSPDNHYPCAVLPRIAGSGLPTAILHDHSVVLLPWFARSQLSTTLPAK